MEDHIMEEDEGFSEEPPRVDRFGFVKQEAECHDELSRARLAWEYDR